MFQPVVPGCESLCWQTCRCKLGRFLRALQRATAAPTLLRLPPLLRICALLAYEVFSGDNLLRGLLLTRWHVPTHQVAMHKPFRRAFLLPK